MTGTAVEFLPSIMSTICILEDQTDHLVVAVRIPKEVLAGAMPFLAALADRTASPIKIPVSAPIPKTKGSSWKYAALLFVTALALVVDVSPTLFRAAVAVTTVSTGVHAEQMFN